MWPTWVILGFLAMLAFAAVCRGLLINPRGDVETGLAWHAMRLYSRLRHHLRIEGRQWIPRGSPAGPLIVVANHTGGVDPVLIQCAVVPEIRWLMSGEMRVRAVDWLWEWSGVIFVDSEGGDVTCAREAIRHVKSGGILGIFPEGGIERPPETILPFLPGVGFIIRRTGAPVLPVVVDGTAKGDTAWTSLVRSSRARVRFMEPIRYGAAKMSPQEIADDLRRRFAEWTGWPLNDAPRPAGTDPESD
jgi:1-acyl-sn-glycerol-3-phosphate acyltransferase